MDIYKHNKSKKNIKFMRFQSERFFLACLLIYIYVFFRVSAYAMVLHIYERTYMYVQIAFIYATIHHMVPIIILASNFIL